MVNSLTTNNDKMLFTLAKQFGHRSSPTKCWGPSGSNQFDTLLDFLIFWDFFFIILHIIKKKIAKLPGMQRVNIEVL